MQKALLGISITAVPIIVTVGSFVFIGLVFIIGTIGVFYNDILISSESEDPEHPQDMEVEK